MEQEKNEKKKLEHELDELTRNCENVRQQTNGQLEQANQKITNLINQIDELNKQLSDKDRTIDSLQRLRTGQTLCGRKGLNLRRNFFILLVIYYELYVNLEHTLSK